MTSSCRIPQHLQDLCPVLCALCFAVRHAPFFRPGEWGKFQSVAIYYLFVHGTLEKRHSTCDIQPGICYNIVITEQYAVKSEKLKVESKAFSVLRCKFSVQWSKCLIVRDLQDLHDLHDLQDQYLCPELCALCFSSSPFSSSLRLLVP